MKIKVLTLVLCGLMSGASAMCAQTVLPLWPTVTPEPPQTTEPETNLKDPDGRITNRLTNITQPSMTVFLPEHETLSGAAAVVFPGGGYQRLAWDKEGLDVCKWLNDIGMACLLVKYRVPEQTHYPQNPADLQDAQQAMRLAREHSGEWGINPARIGVIGFSAGGHLAVVLSNHFDDKSVENTPAASEVNTRITARPEFVILGYPAYLATGPDKTELDPSLTPDSRTPPTFMIQAENDRNYIDSSLVYYRALKDAGVPAELHLYSSGGHGFGMRPVGYPEENWTRTATAWLRRIGMLPGRNGELALMPQGPAVPVPCPSHELTIGRPTTASAPPPGPPSNPNCL